MQESAGCEVAPTRALFARFRLKAKAKSNRACSTDNEQPALFRQPKNAEELHVNYSR